MFDYKRVTVFALVSLGMSGVLIAGSKNGDPRVYGPFNCLSSCQLTMPSPDGPTLEYIRTMDAKLPKELNVTPVKNDVFVICNAVACVKYVRGDAMQYFFGETSYPMVTPGGGGGSGGTEGGTTGGGAAGSGSVNPGPVGSGQVIVRPPVREKPR